MGRRFESCRAHQDTLLPMSRNGHLCAQSLSLVPFDGSTAARRALSTSFVSSPAQKGLGERCQNPILAVMDVAHRNREGTPAHNLAQRPRIAEGRNLGRKGMAQRVDHERHNPAQSQRLGMLLLR